MGIVFNMAEKEKEIVNRLESFDWLEKERVVYVIELFEYSTIGKFHTLYQVKTNHIMI